MKLHVKTNARRRALVSAAAFHSPVTRRLPLWTIISVFPVSDMAEDEEGLSSLAPVSSQRNSLSGDDKQQSAGHPEMLTTRNRRRSSRRLTLTKSCSQSNLDRNHG